MKNEKAKKEKWKILNPKNLNLRYQYFDSLRNHLQGSRKTKKTEIFE